MPLRGRGLARGRAPGSAPILPEDRDVLGYAKKRVATQGPPVLLTTAETRGRGRGAPRGLRRGGPNALRGRGGLGIGGGVRGRGTSLITGNDGNAIASGSGNGNVSGDGRALPSLAGVGAGHLPPKPGSIGGQAEPSTSSIRGGSTADTGGRSWTPRYNPPSGPRGSRDLAMVDRSPVRGDRAVGSSTQWDRDRNKDGEWDRDRDRSRVRDRGWDTGRDNGWNSGSARERTSTTRSNYDYRRSPSPGPSRHHHTYRPASSSTLPDRPYSRHEDGRDRGRGDRSNDSSPSRPIFVDSSPSPQPVSPPLPPPVAAGSNTRSSTPSYSRQHLVFDRSSSSISHSSSSRISSQPQSRPQPPVSVSGKPSGTFLPDEAGRSMPTPLAGPSSLRADSPIPPTMTRAQPPTSSISSNQPHASTQNQSKDQPPAPKPLSMPPPPTQTKYGPSLGKGRVRVQPPSDDTISNLGPTLTSKPVHKAVPAPAEVMVEGKRLIFKPKNPNKPAAQPQPQSDRPVIPAQTAIADSVAPLRLAVHKISNSAPTTTSASSSDPSQNSQPLVSTPSDNKGKGTHSGKGKEEKKEEPVRVKVEPRPEMALPPKPTVIPKTKIRSKSSQKTLSTSETEIGQQVLTEEEAVNDMGMDVDVKPRIPESDAEIHVHEVEGQKTSGTVAFSKKDLPPGCFSKDPKVKSEARAVLRTRQVLALQNEGKKMGKAFWRDDGVAFDWTIITEKLPTASRNTKAATIAETTSPTASAQEALQRAKLRTDTPAVPRPTATSKCAPTVIAAHTGQSESEDELDVIEDTKQNDAGPSSMVIDYPEVASQANNDDPDEEVATNSSSAPTTYLISWPADLATADQRKGHKAAASAFRNKTYDEESKRDSERRPTRNCIIRWDAHEDKGLVISHPILKDDPSTWLPEMFDHCDVFEYRLKADIMPPGAENTFRRWLEQAKSIMSDPDKKHRPTRWVCAKKRRSQIKVLSTLKTREEIEQYNGPEVQVDLAWAPMWAKLRRFGHSTSGKPPAPPFEHLKMPNFPSPNSNLSGFEDVDIDSDSTPQFNRTAQMPLTTPVTESPQEGKGTNAKKRGRKEIGGEGGSASISPQFEKTAKKGKKSKVDNSTSTGSNLISFTSGAPGSPSVSASASGREATSSFQPISTHNGPPASTAGPTKAETPALSSPTSAFGPVQSSFLSSVPSPSTPSSGPSGWLFPTKTPAAHDAGLSSPSQLDGDHNANGRNSTPPPDPSVSLNSDAEPTESVNMEVKPTTSSGGLEALNSTLRQKIAEIEKWTKLLREYPDLSSALSGQISRTQDEIFGLHEDISKERKSLGL